MINSVINKPKQLQHNANNADNFQGPDSIKRLSFPGMGIPMLKVKRSRDRRLIFNMGIPTGQTTSLYWDGP